MTSVPGSSDVFLGGFVTYNNEMKKTLLGVSAGTLETYGAVSAQCAHEMVAGCAKRTGAHWSVAVTGIAGPGGGSTEKPVGTVFIAVSGQNGTHVTEYLFVGGREGVRIRSTQSALALLREQILSS